MPWVQYIGRRALAGDVLGANLISNGHFTSGITGWTDTSAAGGSVSVTPQGTLSMVNATGRPSLTYQMVTVSGTLYAVDLTLVSGTNLSVWLGTSSGGTQLNAEAESSTGTYRYYFVATGTTSYIRINGLSSPGTVVYDNVRVRPVVVRGHAADIEHIIQGRFTIDTAWTKGTGWTIPGGGTASCDGSQIATTALTNPAYTNNVRKGQTYDTSFTVSGYSAGTVQINVQSSGVSEGTARLANGTYTQQIAFAPTASGTYAWQMSASSTFVGSIDNVSVTLAADNTWTLDFDIADMQPGRSRMANSVQTLDGSTDTQYWSSKKTLVVQTDILAYGEWQFLEEFADNAVDGQTVTFDPFGTESQPKAPGSYILTDYSLTRIIGADTTERRQYQLQFREA